MPLYEYQCEVCATRFERIQKYSDPPIDACPACSGAVRKLVSSPAIQFKGSGWYITDYARKGPSDKAGKDGGGSESGSGAAAGKESPGDTSAPPGGSKSVGDTAATSKSTPAKTD